MTASLKHAVVIVAFLSLLALAACGSKGSSAPAISAQDRAEAEALFAKKCASCHGANGDGTGPAAAGLNPKPRNYHDRAWQAATSDEEIEKAIVYGGSAIGKSPNMAANPELQSKPGVVAALREKVRSFEDK
jgi:mono/diheme cytochrome c family protein